jgi:phospholipid/cholesterol/gamma-HCH transport system substrate-binding protein
VLNRSRKNEIVVGIFVIIAFAALMYMTFLIQGTSGSNPYRLKVVYPEVGGLEIGSPVLVTGFRAGRVRHMEAVKGDDGRYEVVVHAEVSRSITLYNDAKVHLRQFGFIGDRRVEIDPGNIAAGAIDESRPIEGVPYKDFTQIFDGGEDIVKNLNKVLANMEKFTSDQERLARIDESLANVAKSSEQVAAILEENRADVREIVQNVQQVTERSVEISRKVDEVVAKAQGSVDEVTALVKELRADREMASGKVERILTNAESVSAKADSLVSTTEDELKRLTDDLESAASELSTLLRKLNRGEGTAGRLLVDPQPFEDLKSSMSSLRGLVIEEPAGEKRELRYRQAP